LAGCCCTAEEEETPPPPPAGEGGSAAILPEGMAVGFAGVTVDTIGVMVCAGNVCVIEGTADGDCLVGASWFGGS